MEALALSEWRRLSILRSQRCAVVLATFTLLFTLRVLAQAIQFMRPTSLLPSFAAFQGSDLPYAVLLPVQLAIVVAMSGATLSVAGGRLVPQPARGRRLFAFGALYLAGALSRLVVGITVPGAAPWFQAWIPAVFHLVLAGFVLVLAAFHLRRL